MDAALNRLNDKEVLPHLRWWACMLPRELIWEGVAPPQQGMTQYAKWPKQKNCKVHEKVSHCILFTVLYQILYYVLLFMMFGLVASFLVRNS